MGGGGVRGGVCVSTGTRGAELFHNVLEKDFNWFWCLGYIVWIYA